jgi:hypothetical protein
MTSCPPLAFTIARTPDDRVLAKRVRRAPGGGTQVRGYDDALWFTLEAASASGIREMGRRMQRLARDPRVALLRGGLRPHIKPGGWYHRRVRATDDTNSLIDRACAWGAIDYDDVSAPEGLDWLRDPEAMAAHLQSLSPPELRGIDHVLQFSGSAGFTGANLIRARAWYAFTGPIADDDLRRWAMAWNAKVGSRLIDFALFNPAQLHYIANPILAHDVADPLPMRWHFIEGVFGERARIVLPRVAAPGAPADGQLAWQALRLGGGFSAWLERIGSIEFGFNSAIVKAAGAATRAGLERRLALAAIRAAVLAADPGHRASDVIARYASDRFIGAAFDRFTRQDAARRLAQARADLGTHTGTSPVTGRRRWDHYRAEGAAIAATQQKGTGHGGPAVPR